MFFRTLLLCYPAAFRHEYAAEMIRTFDQQLREARRTGGWAAVAMIRMRAIADTLFTAPGEHMHVVRQDLVLALRSLSGNPGFTAVAILSLALGIGANTAIFSLLNSVLMRALPVRDAHELVMLTDPGAAGVFIGSQNNNRSLLTYPEFRQLEETGMFAALMAVQSNLDRVRARVDGNEEEIGVRMVSGRYFQTLGVPAAIGRVFGDAEDRAGAAPYAVISDAFWRRRFGGNAAVLGTRLTIRKGVFEIVGVAPPEFFGETVGQRPDVWLPLSMQPSVLPGRDWLHDAPGSFEKVMWLQVFGRLRPGVAMQQAEARANVTFK